MALEKQFLAYGGGGHSASLNLMFLFYFSFCFIIIMPKTIQLDVQLFRKPTYCT